MTAPAVSRAAVGAARPRPAASPEATDRRLHLVTTRPLTAGRWPFVVLVGTVLVGGLVALLLLHTLAAQDAFRLQALQHEQSQLADTTQQLALATQQDQAPDTLAARARALGMVPTGSIAFVEVRRHGKVVGVAKAAPLPPPPAPKPSPTATASAKAAKHQAGAAAADPGKKTHAHARTGPPRRAARHQGG